MSKKISANTVKSLNKLNLQKPVLIKDHTIDDIDIVVEVKDRISYYETIAFTEKLFAEIFSYNDTFYGFSKYIFIKILSIQYFTNITLPDNIDEQMNFVLYSPLAHDIFTTLEKYTPFYAEFIKQLENTIDQEIQKRRIRPVNYTDNMISPETALNFLQVLQNNAQSIEENTTK